MKQLYKGYDENFKRMIVNLFVAGKSVKELMDEYGVSSAAIHSWISKYRASETPIVDSNNNDYYINQLRNEIHQLQAENEILKKALSICIK